MKREVKGYLEFYCDENGLEHRDNGPAIIDNNGRKYWCQHGLLHREGGPAVIHPSGYLAWYKNGVIHREDGPAMENINDEYILSSTDNRWYLNGKSIDCKSNEEFLKLMKLKAFW